MNPVDYSQLPLRDIHLPAAIGWWPPAPGWWMLLLVLLAAAGFALWRYRSHFRERSALKALRTVGESLERGELPIDCVQRISMVVRRFAMSVAEGAPVAGLTGERWLRFLDSRWERDAFAQGSGRLIIYGPYARPERVERADVGTLNDLCIEWIASHRRPR